MNSPQARWWTLALLAACLACAATGAQPTSAKSILGQLVSFGQGELSDLVRQGGQMVELVGDGVATAYSELSDSFSKFVERSLGGKAADANATGQAEDCRGAPEGDGQQCMPEDPDAKRNVSEIIRSRGFEAHEFDVTTRDGYILTIQRIVNPNVDEAYRKKLKPVILQHGLMSSSVDWVINSVHVRPAKWPRAAAAADAAASDEDEGADASDGANSIEAHQMGQVVGDTQEQPNSLGFYLANEGYDVFLANSRGNIYGQRHISMSSWMPKFWDFTFDEQIKYDLPDTIEFVQNLTGHKKVGYVGHSQGTTMGLGLLADQPDYADTLEPVVLLAPVAYVKHCLSPVKYFAIYTPLFQHVNMWFGSSNAAVRFLAPKVCSPKVIKKEVCANLIFLSSGFDEAQFDEDRASAYLTHMPSGTSVKNIAHWGQEVLSGRFAHFDHGLLGNQMRYNTSRPPDYDLTKIRSKSIALFSADNDWLASPKDVARLRAELPNEPLATVNVSQFVPAWNHIDFLYGKDCGRLINWRIVEIFHQFDE